MNHYTQQELETAYQIVREDLFNSLLKIKDGESIRLTNLGKFTKKERKQKCNLDDKNYVYYHLNFKPFSKLKSALNEQVIKKYKLR